jgi:hypothetical protein
MDLWGNFLTSNYQFLKEDCSFTDKKLKTARLQSTSELYRHRLVSEVIADFSVVSRTDSYGYILGFLDRTHLLTGT